MVSPLALNDEKSPATESITLLENPEKTQSNKSTEFDTPVVVYLSMSLPPIDAIRSAENENDDAPLDAVIASTVAGDNNDESTLTAEDSALINPVPLTTSPAMHLTKFNLVFAPKQSKYLSDFPAAMLMSFKPKRALFAFVVS